MLKILYSVQKRAKFQNKDNQILYHNKNHAIKCGTPGAVHFEIQGAPLVNESPQKFRRGFDTPVKLMRNIVQ